MPLLLEISVIESVDELRPVGTVLFGGPDGEHEVVNLIYCQWFFPFTLRPPTIILIPHLLTPLYHPEPLDVLVQLGAGFGLFFGGVPVSPWTSMAIYLAEFFRKTHTIYHPFANRKLLRFFKAVLFLYFLDEAIEIGNALEIHRRHSIRITTQRIKHSVGIFF